MVSASREQLTCYVIEPLAKIGNLVKECHPSGKDSQVIGMEGARALSVPKGVGPLKGSVQECHPQGTDSRTQSRCRNATRKGQTAGATRAEVQRPRSRNGEGHSGIRCRSVTL